METFSRRMGYVQPKMLQLESIDKELKNRLFLYIEKVLYKILETRGERGGYIYLETFKHYIEQNIFKESVKCGYSNEAISNIKIRIDELHEKKEWYVIFDVIELNLAFIFSVYIDISREYENNEIQNDINEILEDENSGYRFQNTKFVPITNEQELQEIADAQAKQEDGVANHIKKAVALFSQRPNPDYENSAKEAISAVEAKLRLLTNSPGEVAGKCLKKIEHPYGSALKDAIGNLYGFCSNHPGIRHSNKPEENIPISFEDAKFILVTSSSIVNLLSDWEAKGQLTIK